MPLFYGKPPAHGVVMRSAISLNGSYYNAQRMLHQYVDNAYTRHRTSVAYGFGTRQPTQARPGS